MPGDKLKGSHDFHESYYEHSCLVKDKDDVLISDIPGASYVDRLKRWWYDLFLLSYADERARIFYTSSEAMRKDRMYHFRKNRNRIHPLSRFRSIRDYLMLFIFIVNRFSIHHNTSFTHSEWCFEFYYIGVIVDMVIIADVILNMTCTGYVDNEERKIVLNSHDGLLHFISTKLFFEFASAIPLQCILLLRYGSNVNCNICKINNFILILKCMSLFGLIRLYECSNTLCREWSSCKLTDFLRFVRIYMLSFFTMMSFIDIADLSVLLTMAAEGKIDDNAYVSGLIRSKFSLTSPQVSTMYWVFNFARISKSLYFPFSHLRRSHNLDKLASILTYMIGKVFIFWTLIEVHSVVNKIHFADDKIFHLQNMVESMAKCQQIPDMASRKLQKYFDCRYTQTKVMKLENILYVSLPEILKREATFSSYMNYIRRIQYFSEWPLKIVEDLALMLKQETYLRNDMIAEPWVQGEGLIVLYTGEVAVYHGKTETGHLIGGDYFGELSLVTDQEMRTSTVVAVTTSVTLLLEKTAFRHYMRQHPNLFHALKEVLMDKYRQKDAR